VLVFHVVCPWTIMKATSQLLHRHDPELREKSTTFPGHARWTTRATARSRMPPGKSLRSNLGCLCCVHPVNDSIISTTGQRRARHNLEIWDNKQGHCQSLFLALLLILNTFRTLWFMPLVYYSDCEYNDVDAVDLIWFLGQIKPATLHEGSISTYLPCRAAVRD
jgi:hypothetical protein